MYFEMSVKSLIFIIILNILDTFLSGFEYYRELRDSQLRCLALVIMYFEMSVKSLIFIIILNILDTFLSGFEYYRELRDSQLRCLALYQLEFREECK